MYNVKVGTDNTLSITENNRKKPLMQFQFEPKKRGKDKTMLMTSKLETKDNLRANQIKHCLNHLLVGGTGRKVKVEDRLAKLAEHFKGNKYESLTDINKDIRQLELN